MIVQKGGPVKTWSGFALGDSSSLAAFLAEEEYRCVALSERLKRLLGQRGEAALRAFGREGSAPLVHLDGHSAAASAGDEAGAPAGYVAGASVGDGAVDGAALLRHDGSGWCILPRDGSGLKEFTELARGTGGLFSLTGPGEDLERIAAALSLTPSDTRRYILMRFPPVGAARSGADAASSIGSAISGSSAARGTRILSKRGSIEIRRASVLDFPALCSLHDAYENEEISTRHRLFSTALPERIMSMLKKQIVVLAFSEGKAIGKANTNARGILTDQLGGIYVSPDARRRGVGAAMVGSLVALLRGQGRGVCLYLRPDNDPARRLYEKLGFFEAGSYASFCFPEEKACGREKG